ncbi:MAG: PilZ domain-containing protein [Terracidiphilus sp.]
MDGHGQAGRSADPAATRGVNDRSAPVRPDDSSARQQLLRARRKEARQDVDTSVQILLINVASRLRGRILDLSLGGCRICTDDRFPVGIYTRVETEFYIEGLPFRLGGVVQQIYDRKTIGIRFLDLSERKRQQVQELIAEIADARAAEGPDDPAA